jgi:hypothetical protein
MTKFIKHDPTSTGPYFSENALIEVKTRDGRVMTADEPWLLTGWIHTGWVNDIMEFRLLGGTMTQPIGNM